jgi:RNA polymerase sigma-70 factor, ECF subfamily
MADDIHSLMYVEAWMRAREAHPDVAVAREVFAAYVDARRPSDLDAEAQLRAYCVEDLYLACACVAGDAAALRAFERTCMPHFDAALARWDRAVADEARQRLRALLLVDAGGRGPLLATYAGRGALRKWLRVVAAREAGRTWRADAQSVPTDDDALFDALAPATDPALAAVKRDAARAFKAAFVEALARLEGRERTVLRLHVLDGLSIDEVAPMYGVHRATAARWIAAAKDLVLGHTRRALMHELRLDAGEVDSLIRLVQSRIELTAPPLAEE